MELEPILNVLYVAAVPVGIYLYHRYVKMTDKDSDGGEKITWAEIVDTFNDAEFWKHVDAVKYAIDEED